MNSRSGKKNGGRKTAVRVICFLLAGLLILSSVAAIAGFFG